jgi:hypothetical protein
MLAFGYTNLAYHMLSIISQVIVVAGLVVYLIVVYRGTKSLTAAILAAVVAWMFAGLFATLLFIIVGALVSVLAPGNSSLSSGVVDAYEVLKPFITLVFVYIAYRTKLLWVTAETGGSATSPELAGTIKSIRTLVILIVGITVVTYAISTASSMLSIGGGLGLSLLLRPVFSFVTLPLVFVLLLSIVRFYVYQARDKKAAIAMGPTEPPTNVA